MAITTQYFYKISYVKLFGNLTLQEVTGSILKYGKSDSFKSIAIRIIDSTELFNVAFDESKMKSFTAIDKSGFLDNEDVCVIMVSAQAEFVNLFEQYAKMMAGTSWQFELVSDLEAAVAICKQMGHPLDITLLD